MLRVKFSLLRIHSCCSPAISSSLSVFFLQLKELEQENEDIRLRNLRRVRTEEKLHTSSDVCLENGGEDSQGGKVSHTHTFCSWPSGATWLAVTGGVQVSVWTHTTVYFLLIFACKCICL